MGEATILTLRQLATCLEDASRCIDRVLNQHDTEHLAAQLTSLRLILDRNRTALQLRIDDVAERRNPKKRAARSAES